jgi:hypothetical protein
LPRTTPPGFREVSQADEKAIESGVREDRDDAEGAVVDETQAVDDSDFGFARRALEEIAEQFGLDEDTRREVVQTLNVYIDSDLTQLPMMARPDMEQFMWSPLSLSSQTTAGWRTLADIGARLGAAPASEAPTERTNSWAKYILGSRSRRMAPEVMMARLHIIQNPERIDG